MKFSQFATILLTLGLGGFLLCPQGGAQPTPQSAPVRKQEAAPERPVTAELYWHKAERGFSFSFQATPPGVDEWLMLLEGHSKKVLSLEEVLMELSTADPSFEIKRLYIDRGARFSQLVLDAGIWVEHSVADELRRKPQTEKETIKRLDDFAFKSISSKESIQRGMEFYLKQREFAKAYELSQELESVVAANALLKKRKTCSIILKRSGGEKRLEAVFDPQGRIVSFSESNTKTVEGKKRTTFAAEFDLTKNMARPFSSLPVSEGHLHEERSTSDQSILGIKLDFRKSGAVVRAVVPTSDAFQGGLRHGDEILRLNGKPLVREKLPELTRGGKVEIEFRTGTGNPKRVVAQKVELKADELVLWLASEPPIIFVDD